VSQCRDEDRRVRCSEQSFDDFGNDRSKIKRDRREQSLRLAENWDTLVKGDRHSARTPSSAEPICSVN